MPLGRVTVKEFAGYVAAMDVLETGDAELS